MIATTLICMATLIGRGYTSAQTYKLTPLPQDNNMLMVRKDQYSFLVDTIEYKSRSRLRLFISDTNANYSSIAGGVLEQSANGRELTLKQVADFQTAEQLYLILSCYD